MRLQRQQSGLTLLEILIALSVFSMIGVASFRLLSTAVTSEQLSKVHSSKLSEIQKTFAVISRDLNFFADRKIREGDNYLASLVINQDFALEFSRAAWSNPLLLDRSQLQRVAYSIGAHPAKDDKDSKHYGSETQYILRHYWAHMDRVNKSEGVFTQVLMADVSRLVIEVVTDKGQYAQWPRPKSANKNTAPERLIGVVLAMTHDNLGDINRTYRLN
jgi:general secretion pathway protein J